MQRPTRKQPWTLQKKQVFLYNQVGPLKSSIISGAQDAAVEMPIGEIESSYASSFKTMSKYAWHYICKTCFIVNIAKLAIIDQIAKQSCLQPPNGACKSLIHAFKLLIDYRVVFLI